jgi:hypothetical protein
VSDVFVAAWATHPGDDPSPVAPGHDGTGDYFAERGGADAPVAWRQYVSQPHEPLAVHCAHLLAALGTERVDTVAVAHEAPDTTPFLSVSGYLASMREPAPLVAAVSDRGTLAPFSALRVAAAYERLGRGTRTAMLAITPRGGVGLLLGDAGPVRLAGLYDLVGVPAAGLSAAVPPSSATVLADAALATHLSGHTDTLVTCAPGDVWPAVVRWCSDPLRRAGPLLVVDHDEEVGDAAAMLLEPTRDQRVERSAR